MWTPGKETPVHDHAGSHCIMKVTGSHRTGNEERILKEVQVLRGSLIETRYDWPDRSAVTKGLVKKGPSDKLGKDQTQYISDRVRLPLQVVTCARANNTIAAARPAQDFDARGFRRVRCISAP